MAISEKRREYAKNMQNLGTQVRKSDAEDFKEWCAMRGVSASAELKRFVLSENKKYYKEMEITQGGNNRSSVYRKLHQIIQRLSEYIVFAGAVASVIMSLYYIALGQILYH